MQALRDGADANGALLILDEVISGFRVARGGAQELHGVEADLTIMGKVIGGGLPAAAYGGRRELMMRIAPAGDVYQAGTLSGNPLAVAAGLATLAELDARAYERLGVLTAHLADGLRTAAESAGVPVQVASVPGLVTPFFSAEPVQRLRRRIELRPRGLRRASAARCSIAASTRPPRSSRPGSSPSPTTRRRSSTPARRPRRRSRSRRPASPPATILAGPCPSPPTPCATSPSCCAPTTRWSARTSSTRATAAVALGGLAAAGERTAAAPGEYALVVEAVREGYLLHYAAAPPASSAAPTATSPCSPATTSTRSGSSASPRSATSTRCASSPT